MWKRIANLFKAFGNFLIGGAEKANPEMLLLQEKENLRKRVAKFNEGLAAHVASTELLLRQVDDQKTRRDKLNRQVQLYLSRKDEATAGKYAVQLEQIETLLKRNETQLDTAESTYQRLLKDRDAIVREADARMHKLDGQISDMKMREATAELVEIANNSFSQIGGSSDTLQRLETMVNERSALAAGKARVAIDSTPELEEGFAEVDEQNALERFKQKQLGTSKVEIISNTKVEDSSI